MAIQRTFELLQALMSGHEMNASELDSLINDTIPEDLFLDYKDGRELNKKEPSLTIRQYLSGFANSEGGILIVGIDGKNWQVTGATAPGGSDLAEWASRCLTDLTPYFSPLPRIHVVSHPNGNVLVASVGRSIGMVPCIERRRAVYYLRIHDQTIQAPEYLIADLLLGRRKRPDLHIHSLETAGLSVLRSPSYGGIGVQFDLQIAVENRGLVWAEDVSIGVVSWIWPPSYPGEMLNNNLLSYLEVEQENNALGERELVHRRLKLGDMAAFSGSRPKIVSSHPLPMQGRPTWYDYVWHAAIYLISRDAPPVWYQLSIQVNEKLHTQARDDRKLELSTDSPLLEQRRLTYERPMVAWTDIQPRP